MISEEKQVFLLPGIEVSCQVLNLERNRIVQKSISSGVAKAAAAAAAAELERHMDLIDIPE